ncbi:hypothetical protein [Mycobacterium sp.]|uniref:hypothetical protein n=1 Tax=Mycobacterium sp. TaxID=1785 RepID=UPI0031D19DE6
MMVMPSRIYGGRLADRPGGSRITMTGYVVGVIGRFMLSGLGNRTVFTTISSIVAAPRHTHTFERVSGGGVLGFTGLSVVVVDTDLGHLCPPSPFQRPACPGPKPRRSRRTWDKQRVGNCAVTPGQSAQNKQFL